MRNSFSYWNYCSYCCTSCQKIEGFVIQVIFKMKNAEKEIEYCVQKKKNQFFDFKNIISIRVIDNILISLQYFACYLFFQI